MWTGTRSEESPQRPGRPPRRWVAATTAVAAMAMSTVVVVGGPAHAGPYCDGPDPPPICGGSQPVPRPSSPPPDPDAGIKADCAASTGWTSPQEPTANQQDDSAPLAITQDAPFGHPLHAAPAGMVQYVRCLAMFASRGARVGLFCPAAGIAMDLRLNTSLPAGTARILAANRSDWGKWFVTHLAGTGENASRWVERGTTTPQTIFFIANPAGPAPGTILRAGTMGFVRTGAFGIAHGECSFTWTSFWPLVERMDVTYTWVY